MIKELLKANQKDPMKIGEALHFMREGVDHGNWAKVLKKNGIGISIRTADRYISVYRRFKDGLPFPIKASILYALAKPSTPDAVVERVLEMLKEGEDVTIELIDAMAEDSGAIQVKLTHAQRIMRELKDAEVELRKAPTLSCIEREDIIAYLCRLLDWANAPEVGT